VLTRAGKEAVSVAQVVFLVETGYADSNGNMRTTQVWQIFLAAPAQNSAQVGVIGSVI
jgi:hypothetical protein